MGNLGPHDVAEARKRLGYTQAEMAMLCGVNVRTWRRWEAEGTGPVQSRLLIKLLEEAL